MCSIGDAVKARRVMCGCCHAVLNEFALGAMVSSHKRNTCRLGELVTSICGVQCMSESGFRDWSEKFHKESGGFHLNIYVCRYSPSRECREDFRSSVHV